MSQPTREQFRDWVIRHVNDRFPLVKVARGDQPFSVRINGHTASLENLYRIGALHPDDTEHQLERWIVELIRASEGRPQDAAAYSEIRDQIMPMILGARPHDDGIVSQSLIEGLRVAYAIDGDRTISYLETERFKSWGIDIDDLHDRALTNLQERSKAIEAHAAKDESGIVNLVLFQTLDGYDASRLLLPDLHSRLRGMLGTPFAAGIPNRDILLCFRNDPAAIDPIRRQIKTDYLSMPHQISDALVLVTPDGLAPL